MHTVCVRLQAVPAGGCTSPGLTAGPSLCRSATFGQVPPLIDQNGGPADVIGYIPGPAARRQLVRHERLPSSRGNGPPPGVVTEQPGERPTARRSDRGAWGNAL